uniref:Peptidoglycan binding-like domain-containing protein n=1 Tax=Picocystis salinarum TaxID=88271 RepID=A0A7S3UBX3_9CHLO
MDALNITRPSWLKKRMRAKSPPTRDLYEGTRGPDVVELQEKLAASGCLDPNLVTGYFGPVTKRAMISWQEEKGLPASGFYGPSSRQLMEDLAHEVVSNASVASAPVEVEKASSTTTFPVAVLLAGTVMIAAHQTYLRFFRTESERYRPRSSVSLKMLEAKRLSMEGTRGMRNHTGRSRMQRPKLPPHSTATKPSKTNRMTGEAKRSLAAKVERLKLQVKEEQTNGETYLVKAPPKQREFPRLDVSSEGGMPRSKKKSYILPPRLQTSGMQDGLESAESQPPSFRKGATARSKSKDLLFGSDNGSKGNYQWPLQRLSGQQHRSLGMQGDQFLYHVEESQENLDKGAMKHRNITNYWGGANGLKP